MRRLHKGKAVFPLPHEFFPNPHMSVHEKEFFQSVARKSCTKVIYYARRHGGPVAWIPLTSSKARVQVFRGKIPGDSTRLSYYCAVTYIKATLEDVAAVFATDSTEKYRKFAKVFAPDYLDCANLCNLVVPTEENPMHYIGMKWHAIESPTLFARPRDFCILECQDEFVDRKTGRRGWVSSMHSVSSSNCPNMEGSLQLIRGSIYRSGYVFIESAEDPTMLEVVHVLQADMKGNIPNYIVSQIMKRRVVQLGRFESYFQRKHLTQNGFAESLVAKRESPECSVCQHRFHFSLEKHNCRKCGQVVCRKCSSVWKTFELDKQNLRICTRCARGSANLQPSAVFTPRPLKRFHSKDWLLSMRSALVQNPFRPSVSLSCDVHHQQDITQASLEVHDTPVKPSTIRNTAQYCKENEDELPGDEENRENATVFGLEHESIIFHSIRSSGPLSPVNQRPEEQSWQFTNLVASVTQRLSEMSDLTPEEMIIFQQLQRQSEVSLVRPSEYKPKDELATLDESCEWEEEEEEEDESDHETSQTEQYDYLSENLVRQSIIERKDSGISLKSLHSSTMEEIISKLIGRLPEEDPTMLPTICQVYVVFKFAFLTIIDHTVSIQMSSYLKSYDTYSLSRQFRFPMPMSKQREALKEAARLLRDSKQEDYKQKTTCSDDEDDEKNTLAAAVKILKKCHAECTQNTTGTSTITTCDIDTLLTVFIELVDPETPVYTRAVERNLMRKFSSHKHVFDDKVQGFIHQNYSSKNEDTKENFRAALRRTSLVQRCVKAFRGARANTPDNSMEKRHSLDGAPERTYPIGTLETFWASDQTASFQLIKKELARLSTWSFNVFEVSKVQGANVLLIVGCSCFDAEGLTRHFHIPSHVLRTFYFGVQTKYLANPYHNVEHAADVTQCVHHFLTLGGLGTQVSMRGKLAALIAASVHDIGHTGYSNNFHIATNDALAIRYAYRSPLENMHCAVAFELMQQKECDVLATLSDVEKIEVRNLIIDMILATDNKNHAIHLGRLDGLLQSADEDRTDFSNLDDQKLLLQVALHAADVCNPVKPLPIYTVWTERIMTEFYAQGDKERELGLPVSFGCDRINPIPEAKMQAGFIIGIVRPVFETLAKVPKVSLKHCLDQVERNLGHWQDQLTANTPPPIATL
ncbi:hypothetical protein THRCLA_02779 [Thraustotheca clavata]|uniref:Phosphodiesterase n=1 Tax=Thraustotheca clavata TaxID=74557 RepID=A0A1W0A469_9STRA|nr:hypothetical protein THRCLA_02779 [Thraustotheca clavata]